MNAPAFSQIRDKYLRLFDQALIPDDKLHTIDDLITRVESHQQQYETVAQPLGVPWYVVGLIHCMEGNINFRRRLQDGAFLPKGADTPADWNASATRVLKDQGFDRWRDWSVPGIFYKLEAYNGWGYYSRQVNTPYLWSFSQFYRKGKFTVDHEYDPDFVSDQIGAALILRRMVDVGLVSHEEAAPEGPPAPPEPEAPAVEPHEAPSATYTVRRGDTLWHIGRRFGVSWRELAEINPQIEDPNKIFPGQVIKLPPGIAVTPAPSPGTVPETPPAPEPQSYRVKPGDTLEGLAQLLKIPLAALVKMNPRLLETVPELLVPKTPPPAGPAPEEGEPPWLQKAFIEKDYFHVAEIPGPAKNERILMYHDSTDQKIEEEEGEAGAWCSSFVNWCITTSGYRGTNNAWSLSWLHNGVHLDSPKPGCIVVLWRNRPVKPSKGHVGFYMREDPDDPDRLLLLGGNQSDAVTITSIRKIMVLDYRFPVKA